MRNKRATWLGCVGIATTLAVGVLTGPASAAATTGTISGVFDDAHGHPIADAPVGVYTPDQTYIGGATTTASGAYAVHNLPAGTYIVEFTNGSLNEWSHDHFNAWEADPVTVTAGVATKLTETAIAMGTLTGTLTKADGTPAVNVFVGAASNNSGYYANTQTDDAGQWSIPVPVNPDYEVSFALTDYLTQFAPHEPAQDYAGLYPVTADQTVTVNDQLLPTGTISGSYTDAAGNPDGDAQVAASLTDGAPITSTTTDDDGTYRMTVFAGSSYIVSFAGSDGKQQWAHGQLFQESADAYPVTTDATTTVDDAELATGTVTITGTDAATGAPVANFCAYIDNESACTTTGTATVTDVRAGSEPIDIETTGSKYQTVQQFRSTVIAGQDNPIAVAFQPAATIKATIVDAVTGQPVANACVLNFVPGFTVWPDSRGFCSNKNGVATLYGLQTGSYALFVSPPSGSVYGAQWVGHGGGTGLEQQAVIVTANAGATKNAGTIKLDHAGIVSGTVTGPDGTPLSGVLVGPNAYTPGPGSPGFDIGTDVAGHYSLTNLGPYQWPIFAMAQADQGAASQWTGAVANRYAASTVQVTAGAGATDNIALTDGTVLKGTALKLDGTPVTPGGGYVVAYNATTGDVMAYGNAAADGSFSMPILAGQKVRVGYQFSTPQGQVFDGYFGGTNHDTAKVIGIPAAGKTIHIVLEPGTGN